MKNIKLISALLIIAGLIWYIESTKSQAPAGQIEKITVPVATGDRSDIIFNKSVKYPSAVELIPGGKFLNTEPFKIRDLIGKKVILLDFWTYSCINCLRTLPYLRGWYEKYKDKGLVIIGVHTPEFDFEKDYGNLTKALKDLGVPYPVLQDNDYATWNAYGNRYWPREYLIDIDGYIIHDKIGEGDYEETERLIQAALNERASVLHEIGIGDMDVTEPVGVIRTTPSMVRSPEVYFGSGRNEFLENGKQGVSGIQNPKVPVDPEANKLYLGGVWDITTQFAENKESDAEVVFKYNSKDVYFVGSSAVGVNIKIFLDGKYIDTVLIKENRLYTIIKGFDYGEHTLKLIIDSPGLNAFTFTFG